MGTYLIITNIFILLLFIIFGLLFKIYFPSYLSEKAKNLADKQDISEITEKIELVKSEFTSKTEMLKSDLQLALNYQIEHRNEERRIIIEFHHTLNEWICRCSHIDIVSYHQGNVPDLLIKRREITDLYDKCTLSKSKLELLVKNIHIQEIASKLMVEGFKFSSEVELFLLNLYHKRNDRNYFTDRFIKIYKEIDKKEEAIRLASDDTKVKNEIDEIIHNFLTSKIDRIKPIFELLNEFNIIAKEYLLKTN